MRRVPEIGTGCELLKKINRRILLSEGEPAMIVSIPVAHSDPQSREPPTGAEPDNQHEQPEG